MAFFGTFLLLLPATAAMGATLPAMERIVARARGQAAGDRSIAALYAGNTFGAVLGVLAAAFWLVARLGLARTAGICIALNLLVRRDVAGAVPGAARSPRRARPPAIARDCPGARGCSRASR